MYMGIASLGSIFAPSLGPIIGGLLSQYLGWPSIFWFLAIAATAFFVPFLLFFPETCRAVVGDGSVRAPRANQTLFQCLTQRRKGEDEEIGSERETASTEKRRINLPNPLATLRILFQLPVSLIMLGNGIVFASYYAVMSSIPSQFEITYELNDLQIGLAFIPAGLGTLCSAFMNGMLVDWNYRRMEAKLGKSSERGQKQNVKNFPIERARLQIALPMMVFFFR
jgi:MFS family permease